MSGKTVPSGPGGEGSAEFAAVAERVAPRLYRIAVRMCGNPADAEDLVQDTLLQAFRKWQQFQGRSEPSTWMYTIAGRLCQRRHRRRAGEPARMQSLSELLPSPADPLVVLPASADGPVEAHARKEAERAVAEGLRRLPAPFRLPLVLADIAELPSSDIARVLGLKEATVKTRIHRGRLLIRKALMERLPTRPAPPVDHDRQVCLDLLQAKQEALDHHTPFPFSGEELCARCQSLFATLDLGREVCGLLTGDTLPESVQQLIRRQRIEGATARHRGTHARGSRVAPGTAPRRAGRTH